MKTFVVVAVAVGVVGGLAIYVMSGQQPPRARSPDLNKTATTDIRAATRTPLPGNPSTPESSQNAPPATPPIPESPEEQSRKLQLEIGRALVSIDDAERDRAYRQLLPALIKLDPAAVKQLVANYPTGPVRDELLRRTAQAWSAVSVDGAIEWATGMTEADERNIVASGIVSHVAQGDPARAIGVSDQFGIGRNDGTVDRIVQLWATEKLQEALSWAEGQLPGTQRDQILARIATVQAETAPADAATTALTQITVGPTQDDTVAQVVHQWATQDPDAASAWVDALPNGHIRDVAKAATLPNRAAAAANGSHSR